MITLITVSVLGSEPTMGRIAESETEITGAEDMGNAVKEADALCFYYVQSAVADSGEGGGL